MVSNDNVLGGNQNLNDQNVIHEILRNNSIPGNLNSPIHITSGIPSLHRVK